MLLGLSGLTSLQTVAETARIGRLVLMQNGELPSQYERVNLSIFVLFGNIHSIM